MALTVEIDPNSGFCGGVIRAIDTAEKFLSDNPDKHLYSLGAIVHNEEELSRLSARGLVTVSKNDLSGAVPEAGSSLLIRAHGEPPETYRMAASMGYDILDCTCPVVLKLQKDIRSAYERLKVEGRGGQVVIFGKIGHAEVLGLVGQVGGDAVVVEDLGMLRRFLFDGTIRPDAPIEIFSQTTKSPEVYSVICDELTSVMSDPADLHVHDTICSQVASRHKGLSDFALNHDVIIFVSGKMSSNGSVLCDLCKSLNIRTFHISSASEIKREWFGLDDKVGVCGATSTPKWLLEEVAAAIEFFAR